MPSRLQLEHTRSNDPHGEQGIQYLDNIPICFWATSSSSTRSKCDQLENNNFESWNNVILEARDKPIINFFEHVRRILMKTNQERREMKGDNLLCLAIQEEMEKAIVDSRKCDMFYVGQLLFEIDCGSRSYEVDLNSRICECRK